MGIHPGILTRNHFIKLWLIKEQRESHGRRGKENVNPDFKFFNNIEVEGVSTKILSL
jgi:hypothetical protein